jgi:hypothetical protein
MTHLIRLRPRLTALTLPLISLTGISAVVSFLSVFELGEWAFYTLWITAGITAIILWLVPAAKFASTFIDVKTDGLFISTGFGSTRRHKLSWSEIATITSSPMRGITITTTDDEELVLRGYAQQKAIVAELTSLHKRK